MSRRSTRSLWVLAFAGWTLFVWLGRIRNAGSDAGTVLLATTFVVPAVVMLRPKHRNAIVGPLALWTVLVWAVRAPLVWIHVHSVAFRIVHTVLATVSIGLGVLAHRDVQRERQAPAAAAGLQELPDR